MPEARPRPQVAVCLRSDRAEQLRKGRSYVDWIVRCGGRVRIVAPGTRGPLLGCSGLLLTGGEDVAPELYGEANRHCGRLNPKRDAFELKLLRSALRRDLPIFAVCRGAQLLAVALRGSLYQDLRRDPPPGPRVAHRGPGRTDTVHSVAVEPRSLLARLVGKRSLRVNSHHHQGIRRLPRVLRAAARSDDGLVEAIEHRWRAFVVGVQWHPERSNEPSSEALMKAFLAACRRRRRS
ncbi:MAG TPA: gamma-glutamyl-gamma-aminobutyrate hydrolase family protein [Thermoanaerobaculia bacterium]|nr:gamma-glutamyl-gamma-aminobutyrate hydrolase family protein [Thermoanaerobaculia bacterium]